MELIDRTPFLELLQATLAKVKEGDGHCVFVSGETGIGKTTLTNEFCKAQNKDTHIFKGTCDALFTPRPLAPLYDIAEQMQSDIRTISENGTDRAALFSDFLAALQKQKGVTVLVIEDIHWIDEATLDFVKFLARRITRVHCLFILTYRDNEIDPGSAAWQLFGQIPPDNFTRLKLTPLSQKSVNKMAQDKGYKGDDLYRITGGNPFYVTEILSSGFPGIPENVKDSIFSSFNRLDEKIKQVCNLLSILPSGIELNYFETINPSYSSAVAFCLNSKILRLENGRIGFKHELYRRTIEDSLSPFLKIELNKKILHLFKDSFEKTGEVERIVHHAKAGNEYDSIVHYAPIAARKAATVGSHKEAAKLFRVAITYYEGQDTDKLVEFYNGYAYECYLTNEIDEAIVYTEKELNLLKEKNDVFKTGNCMRFLSRLWWFNGNAEKAEVYAKQVIDILANVPASKAKAMGFSNMSQLKMLSEDFETCRFWGNKAIAMAKEMGDNQTFSHALINVAMIDASDSSTRRKGREMLQQSLDIAIKNNYDEIAARAYANLSSNAVRSKEYDYAKKILEEGILFCDDRELYLARAYLFGYKARLYLETGHWHEALQIANGVVNEQQPPVGTIAAVVVAATIKMRTSDTDILPELVRAKENAFKSQEPQRILPAITALLEYEWITGKRLIEENALAEVSRMIKEKGNVYENSAFAFWLLKGRNIKAYPKDFFKGYQVSDRNSALAAARLWKTIGCPYEEALALFEGNESDKKAAIEIVLNLGADMVYRKMKLEMRAYGIRSIPRGARKSTRSNPKNLTQREMEILGHLGAGLQNKEIAAKLFIAPRTVDHHISSIFFKLDVNSRTKAVHEAIQQGIIIR